MGKPFVLLLNGETIQALAMAEYLVKDGYDVGAVCDDKISYGYHNSHVSR